MKSPGSNHHNDHQLLIRFMYLSVAAAVLIIWTSIQRLLAPQPLEEMGIGLLLTTAASVLNLIVGVVLIRMGKSTARLPSRPMAST